MSEILICPCCASPKINRRFEENKEFNFLETIYKCDDCGEEGDFFCDNDKHIELYQLKKAAREFVDFINNIHVHGFCISDDELKSLVEFQALKEMVGRE